jgi:hypothetical protein
MDHHVLQLTPKREPIDEIVQGEKPKEYCRYKTYRRRLEGVSGMPLSFATARVRTRLKMLVAYIGLSRDGRPETPIASFGSVAS